MLFRSSINVIDPGTTTGLIYDAITYATTATTGNGVTATVTYNGLNAFAINDTVYVYGVTPAGYNTTGATVTGIGSNTVQYANATVAAMSVAGLVLNKKDSQRITSVPTTIGSFAVGALFKNGMTFIPGTGQSINVNYTLS